MLVYMDNYTCPKSCISQIWPESFVPHETSPALSAPLGLLDELLNKFWYPVLGRPADFIPGI